MGTMRDMRRLTFQPIALEHQHMTIAIMYEKFQIQNVRIPFHTLQFVSNNQQDVSSVMYFIIIILLL